MWKWIKENYVLLIIGTLILIGFMINSVIPGYRNYRINKAKEENNNAYFTKDKISLNEIYVVDEIFGAKSTPNYRKEVIEKSGSDFSYVTVKPTEYTDEVIAVINFYMFDQCGGTFLEARKVAESYGLSYEKRMTTKWFMEHLHESVEIKNVFYTAFDIPSEVHEEKEWLDAKTLFTKQQLTYIEIATLEEIFRIKDNSIVTSFRMNYGKKDQDYSTMTMQASEYTDNVISYINYLLFTESSKKNQKAIEKATEYGLTKENQMTWEWILEHPRELLEIKNIMDNYGSVLYALEAADFSSEGL
jgi:hypothetical protein